MGSCQSISRPPSSPNSSPRPKKKGKKLKKLRPKKEKQQKAPMGVKNEALTSTLRTLDSDETSEEAEEELAETNKSRQVQGLVDISDLPVDELGLLLDPIGALEEELDKCEKDVDEARGILYSASGELEVGTGLGEGSTVAGLGPEDDINSIDISVIEKNTHETEVGRHGGGYCVNLTGEGVEMMEILEGDNNNLEGGVGGGVAGKGGRESEMTNRGGDEEDQGDAVLDDHEKDNLSKDEPTSLKENFDGIHISTSSSRLTDEESGATDFDSEEEGEDVEDGEEGGEEKEEGEDRTPRHKLFRLLQKQSKLLQLTGNTTSAKATLQEMIHLATKRESDDSSENDDFNLKLAQAQHDLGTVARMEKDFELSCDVLEKSIKLKSDILGDLSTSVASSLSALSLTKKLMGKEDEATILNRKAMRIFHETDTTRSREGGWLGGS
ncbi:hypothetical protein TrVE_jg7761 [Triparma verrucosa]|uniref:Uncharacterized protein n=1 Tax=Triparma verrucosa TaxID=1606542 RepID=A0A9W7BUI8_9STRA|nr:hypothetical protein TrVE_jg7761 [Triparma verrucosa]